MIVKFDALNRFERPLFYLCNPGTKYEDGVLTKAIGILSDTSDEELNVEFNTTSTLSLRAYKRDYEDPDENEFFHDLFNKIQNRRLIYIEDLGFFVIRNTETGYDDGITYKDIEAYSCEDELSDKQLPYIANDTYKFDEIFSKIMATVPMWTIGYQDPDVIGKYRTFEDVATDQNVLSFLLEDMQDAYECIFTFNTILRSVSVYSQSNYVKETDIHITKDDIVNSVEIQEDSDDMYTALSVFGGEDLSIAAVNPLGTSTIYNFDYYLDWMSPELAAKVKEWQRLVKYYSNYDSNTPDNDNYPRLGVQYATEYAAYLESVAEIERIKTVRDMYQRCYDNIAVVSGNGMVRDYNDVIISVGGEPIPENIPQVKELQAAVKGLINKANQELAAAEARRDQLDASAKAIQAKMQAINDKVSINKYFTANEYEELACYISEGTYTDDYVIITDIMSYVEQYNQLRALYERALTQLEKISRPTEQFSIDTENFLFQKSFAHFSSQLETGCIVNVGVRDDEIVPLFLSAIEVNFDDLKLSLTFGNRFCRFDPKAMFQDVLGNVKRSANSIEFLKDAISPLENGGVEQFRQHLAELRDLSKQHAMEATNQSVVIDDTGYTGKKVLGDYDFDPKQIKIVNNGIFLTKDAWDTCDVAIGELSFLNQDGSEYTQYGINAHILAGDILIGSELHLMYHEESTGENKDVIERMNTFEFGKNGLNSKVGYGEVISSINQSAEEVKIQANRITLEGFVSLNEGVQIDENGYLIAHDAQFNNVNMNNLTMSGDIDITGNIRWSANNSPCLALYGREPYAKPTGAYSTFPETSISGWHRKVDETYDFYVSYTYDGGATWTYAVRYQGVNGEDGSDASVTRDAMIRALLNDVNGQDGIYVEYDSRGVPYLGIRATVIKGTLLLGDELQISGNVDIGGDLTLGGDLYLNKDDGGVDLWYPNGDELGSTLNLINGSIHTFTDNRSSINGTTVLDTDWTITPKESQGKLLSIETNHHVHTSFLEADNIYSTANIGCKDLVCTELNVKNIHVHTGLTVPNKYGLKTYPSGSRTEVTLAYMDSNNWMYYGTAGYNAQLLGTDTLVVGVERGPDGATNLQYTKSLQLQGESISFYTNKYWYDGYNKKIAVMELKGGDIYIGSGETNTDIRLTNVDLHGILHLYDTSIQNSYGDHLLQQNQTSDYVELGNTTDSTQIFGSTVYVGSSATSMIKFLGRSIDFNNLSVSNLSVTADVPSSLSLTSLTVSTSATFNCAVSIGDNKPLRSNSITLVDQYSGNVYVGDSNADTILRGNTVKLKSTSGEAVTSDKRNKYDIGGIDDPYETFMMNLQPVRYKYNNGNVGRYHTGFIAQDVMDAMITAGLDSTEFGGYIDLDGTGELGLIYSEFISLNTYMIQKLYRRIEDLERKVELLSRN